MNKYRLIGTSNFLLGVISICLPLFIYASIVQTKGERFFVDIIFNIPNQTLFKVLIFNAFLGVINFSFGIVTFAMPTAQRRKYYTDNWVLSLTAFFFLVVVIIYTYLLTNGIIF